MEHIVAPPALSNAKVNDMDEAVALGEAVALSEAVALGEELRIANHEVIEALKQSRSENDQKAEELKQMTDRAEQAERHASSQQQQLEACNGQIQALEGELVAERQRIERKKVKSSAMSKISAAKDR